MERRRCNHHELDNPLSTLDCFKSIIDPKDNRTNKHRYIVASQEREVREWCRGVAGVPLVYVQRSVMIMEPMANASEVVKEKEDKQKFRSGLRDTPGQKRKRADDVREGGMVREGLETVENEVQQEKATKKRKARSKEPNPLSVKKTKKVPKETKFVGDTREVVKPDEAVDGSIDDNPKKKRRRKHKPTAAEDAEERSGVTEDAEEDA
jgi:U3 small nucleolar RNA-associated protein 23